MSIGLGPAGSVLGSRKAGVFDGQEAKRHRGAEIRTEEDLQAEFFPHEQLERIRGQSDYSRLLSPKDLEGKIRDALEELELPEQSWSGVDGISWLADHVLGTGLPSLLSQAKKRIRFFRQDTLQMMTYELQLRNEPGSESLNEFILMLLPERKFSRLGQGSFKSVRKVSLLYFQRQGNSYNSEVRVAAELKVRSSRLIKNVHGSMCLLEELCTQVDDEAKRHLLKPYDHWHPASEKCSYFAPLALGDLAQKAGDVSAAQLLQFAVDLARTLVQVHAADLCIADIKADNILLFGDGDGLRASFFDFDLLREIGADFDLNPARWEEYKFVQFGRTTHSTEKAGAYTDVVALIKAIMGVFNRFDRDFDLSVYLRLWTPRGVHPKGFEFLTKTTLKQRWLYSLVRASQAKATQGLIEGLAKLSAPSSAYKRITENPGKFVVADAGSKEDAVDRLALGMKLWQVFNNVLLADWHKSRGTYYSNGDHLTAGYLLDEFTNLQSELQKAKK